MAPVRLDGADEPPVSSRAVTSAGRVGLADGTLGQVRQAVSRHPDALALCAVLAVGAALRLAFWPRAPVFIGGDTSQYYLPAWALMHGEGLPLPFKRPPLYPLFVALVGWGISPDLRVLVAIQHALGLGTAALAYGIGRLCFGRAVGLMSGLAAAVSGGLLIFEHYVLTEALFTVLLALSVFLLLVALRRHAWWWHVGAGLAIGLAILTRPHAQVLLALGPAMALLLYRRWRPAARATALILAAAALVVVPWMARNAVVHDSFAVVGAIGQNLVFKMVSLHAGAFVFYDPANPAHAADPDPQRRQARVILQDVTDDKIKRPSLRVSNRELHARLMEELNVGEARADAIMREVALDAIRARPLVFARFAFDDFRQIMVGEPDRLNYHWRLRERTGGPRGVDLETLAGEVTPEQERGRPTTERLVTLYQSPLLGWTVPALFFVGLVAAAVTPAHRIALLPGLTALGLHAGSAAVVGYVARFHHPPDPLVHVVAIGGALWAIQLALALPRRTRSRLPAEQTQPETASASPVTS